MRYLLRAPQTGMMTFHRSLLLESKRDSAMYQEVVVVVNLVVLLQQKQSDSEAFFEEAPFGRCEQHDFGVEEQQKRLENSFGPLPTNSEKKAAVQRLKRNDHLWSSTTTCFHMPDSKKGQRLFLLPITQNGYKNIFFSYKGFLPYHSEEGFLPLDFYLAIQ